MAGLISSPLHVTHNIPPGDWHNRSKLDANLKDLQKPYGSANTNTNNANSDNNAMPMAMATNGGAVAGGRIDDAEGDMGRKLDAAAKKAKEERKQQMRDLRVANGLPAEEEGWWKRVKGKIKGGSKEKGGREGGNQGFEGAGEVGNDGVIR